MSKRDSPQEYFDFLVSRNRLEEEDYIGYMDNLHDEFGVKDVYSGTEMVNAFGSYKKAKDEDLFSDLVDAHGRISGLELSTLSGKDHVLITPEAQEPGKFRLTQFSKIGINGHNTYDTEEETLKQAILEGYSKYDPGVMDALARTDEWAEGMASLGRIDAAKRELSI